MLASQKPFDTLHPLLVHGEQCPSLCTAKVESLSVDVRYICLVALAIGPSLLLLSEGYKLFGARHHQKELWVMPTTTSTSPLVATPFIKEVHLQSKFVHKSHSGELRPAVQNMVVDTSIQVKDSPNAPLSGLWSLGSFPKWIWAMGTIAIMLVSRLCQRFTMKPPLHVLDARYLAQDEPHANLYAYP